MITGATDFLAYLVKNAILRFLHLIFSWLLQTRQMNAFQRSHGVYKVMTDVQAAKQVKQPVLSQSTKMITELDNCDEGKLHNYYSLSN